MSTQTTALSGHINDNGGSVDELRAARQALNEAVDDGAAYLASLRDEIEDALIEELARARREREGVAA